VLRSVVVCVGIASLAMIAPTPATPVSQAAVVTQDYVVNGVAVRKYIPSTPNGAPPVVMVHGGAHGKWVFDKFARILSAAGYECHALDWLNHGSSATLPMSTFLNRSILDVTHREIRDVVSRLGRPPILMGHSMGGLASLAYASENPVARLVLLTPVVPSSVGAQPIEIAVDWSKPFGPFPYDVAKQLFFPALDEQSARAYHAMLVPESPRAVWEATRWTVNVGLHGVSAPVYVVAAERDTLTPPSAVSVLAGMLDADYRLMPGIGHSDVLLKDPEATQLANQIRTWLAAP
jgi:pimeloyl-ACP methyl ester carboxylesterase